MSTVGYMTLGRAGSGLYVSNRDIEHGPFNNVNDTETKKYKIVIIRNRNRLLCS